MSHSICVSRDTHTQLFLTTCPPIFFDFFARSYFNRFDFLTSIYDGNIRRCTRIIYPVITASFRFCFAQRTVVVPSDERDINGNRRPDADANVDRNNNDPNGNDDNDDDDCLSVTPLPPDNRRNRNGCQRQQSTLRQPWRSSTSSLDKPGMNRDHSSDSLDRVEFCSTTDYR